MHCRSMKSCYSEYYWVLIISASDITQMDDMDELEVYGDQPTRQINSQICQYTFEVSHFDVIV